MFWIFLGGRWFDQLGRYGNDDDGSNAVCDDDGNGEQILTKFIEDHSPKEPRF